MERQPSSLVPFLFAVLGSSDRAHAALHSDKVAARGSGSPVSVARGPVHGAERVFFDLPGDGSIWVRGADYKAGFGVDGARIFPRLGARAVGDHGLRLAPVALVRGGEPIGFERAASAAREGDAVVYDRGSFVERYTAAPRSIEQTFVFESLHGAGDLRLRIELETSLRPGESAAGLRFDCDLGGLRYSRAVALDAAGQHLPLETRLAGGVIEILIPDGFLASAVFPMTIDPVITTFAIDTTTPDDFAPDVAYDATSDRYMVCYEEAYTANDHDVYERLLDANGALIGGGYIDFSDTDVRHPRIANNEIADQFMVVAHAGDAGSRSIVSRVVSTTNVFGPLVTVASAGTGYEWVNPDIGGDPAMNGTSFYLVVFEDVTFSTGNRSIVQQLMRTTGLPDSLAPTCIDCNPGKRFNPAISKSAGRVGSGVDHRWNIAWEYEYDLADHDIHGAQNFNAWTVTGPFSINTSTEDDRLPTVSSYTDLSSTPGNYLVAFQRNYFGGGKDILGHLMNGATVVASANLSLLEGPAFSSQDQIQPDADSDGCAFTVAYSELYLTSTTDWDVYVSTFTQTAGALVAHEVHQNLAFSSLPEIDTRLTATRGGPALRTMAAWTYSSAGDSDIYGGQYVIPTSVPYCFPGSDGVAGCPCSNPPSGSKGCNNSGGTGGAVLAAAGTSSLGADTLSFTQSGELATATSIFLQGDVVLATGTTFGDGVRCVGGTLKRLYVRAATGGTVSAPVGADPSVSSRSAALGDTIPPCGSRFYQVYYRDPDLSFCPGGFNIGNGIRVLWTP